VGGPFLEAFNAFSDQDRAEFLRAYYAGVSFMDSQVGRLLDTLDRLRLWDSTLVVFMGDNGYHHNERGWWNKATLFERSCRVPFIAVAPGTKGGQVCTSLIEAVDLYPTVVDYCNLTAPHPLAGQSLRPLLANPTAKGRDAAFTLVARGAKQYGQAVRTDRWRYIQWSDGNAELYDEQNDPQELHNIARSAENAGHVKDHKELLKRVGPFQFSEPPAPAKRDRSPETTSGVRQ
jgi:iduronate 2-sulfatase